MNGIEELCPKCGLCCDSTLFADVELQRGDDPKKLAALGVPLMQKTRTKLAFPQPCSCFDGRLCQIYADRPQRCRAFDCGLLKRVNAGELTVPAALKQITAARRQANKVRTLLQTLGQRDTTQPLTHRYQEAMCAPVDLAHKNNAEKQGKLMLAVTELMTRLQRDFLR